MGVGYLADDVGNQHLACLRQLLERNGRRSQPRSLQDPEVEMTCGTLYFENFPRLKPRLNGKFSLGPIGVI